MYSLVLMAAMTSTAQAPAIFFGGGCGGCRGFLGGLNLFFGCRGCVGTSYSCGGCGGYSSYGCQGVSYGCHGCWGNAPVPAPARSYSSPPSNPNTVNKPVEQVEQAPEPRTPESHLEMTPNRARLIVQVPADAKVYINDQPMRIRSGTLRNFITPELEDGETYYYMLRAETVRDGKTFAETQRVVVRPGGEFRTSFADLTSSIATTSAALSPPSLTLKH